MKLTFEQVAKMVDKRKSYTILNAYKDMKPSALYTKPIPKIRQIA